MGDIKGSKAMKQAYEMGKLFDWSVTYNEQVELRKQKFKELFGVAKFSAAVIGPNFCDIVNHFIFGEVLFKKFNR
jgi:hypothetical protein